MDERPGVNAGASSAHPADGARGFAALVRKVMRSFRVLVAEPGVLTRERERGRAHLYLAPVPLFVLVNLLFFAALTFTGARSLAPPLRVQLYEQAYSGEARSAVRDRFLEMDSVAFERFETRFDAASETAAKALPVVLVPLFTLLLWLTRAWQRERAAQHLVFSTHYISALLLLLTLLALASLVIRSERALAWGLVVCCAVYLYPALRNAYGDGRGAALIRAGVLGVATLLLVLLYRFILFFTVLYTI